MKYKYPFIKPQFPSVEEIAEDYRQIIKSNWFTNFGHFEQTLSKLSADYVGAVSATTVSNCTQGLDLAIATLFDKKKKKVLVQAFTFAAGPEMLIKNNFTPVFIDIDSKTWQSNIDQAKSALKQDKTIGGILLCNTFGVGNPDITEWENLALEYNIPLIIDSAAGFGSKYANGEVVGLRGDCEVFSLHATKPFGVGEGGLILSKNTQLIDDLRSRMNFGFQADRIVHEIGTNAKMDELSCAIGVRQIKRLQHRIEERQHKLRIFKDSLQESGFVFQENDENSSIAFVSTLVPEHIDVDTVQQYLFTKSVEARRYYTPALHLHPKLMEYSEIFSSLENTEKISERILSLPLLHDMKESDIIEICESLKSFVEEIT